MTPFSGHKGFEAFEFRLRKLLNEIYALSNDEVLTTSLTALEERYLAKAYVPPLGLHVDKFYVEQEGTDLHVKLDYGRTPLLGPRAPVRGTNLKVVIPYEGDRTLWGLRPSKVRSGYPEIGTQDDTICFIIPFADENADGARIRQKVDEYTRYLVEGVGYINGDVERHNENAKRQILQALERKRKDATTSQQALVDSGLPIRRRQELPAFALPLKRKPAPVRPAVTHGKYEAEPALEVKEYEFILGVLRSASLVMERCPDAFETIGEEAIRMTFLVLLNGHYEGQATGETFNSAGKTDIIIRSGDRNVFIAECKFWHGRKAFDETIDQLLRYLTWRDTKCALLIFNTNKDTAGVRATMHEAMQGRTECKKVISNDPTGDARYVLVKPSEPTRDIIVTTQIYDIPRETVIQDNPEKPMRERRVAPKQRTELDRN